tara:strand:- start:16750 stop:18594 length:1845 start_codon:yes stop_codon:yes gene_type:complete
MCGIIGFNFFKEQNSYLNLMSHRGPDFSESFKIDNFTFGHNRLSIVDHNDDSNQPMFSICQNYVIIFNGEIYNHNELRNEIKSEFNFRTNSDTEVILNSYIKFGEKCLDKFQGMFSFAIYDKKLKKLFCARDRIGIKPFNYYFKGGKFIFASETKAILDILDSKPKINNQAILQYLHYLYVPEPNTIFEDIKKLPPGHSLVYQNGEIKINRYWNIENYIGNYQHLNENEIIEELGRLINNSVSKRMIADVELGSFLSGGLDSSTILYYMSKNSSNPVNTYTLGFKDAKKYDETKDAKLLSEYFGTNHNEIIIEPNITSLLPKMVKHFDEPFGNPTSLLIHELTKETKKFATVALAGDGGDEIFGGYPRYEALNLYSKTKYLPKQLFKLLSSFIKFLPESSSGNHQIRRIKTFINSRSKNENEMYEDWISYFSDKEMKLLFKNFLPYKKTVQDVWDNISHKDLILKSSIVDIKTFLPNNLLHYGDAMSMANSFEVRFPLIDHHIVEFMTGVDSKLRIKNNNKKYLLKKLLKNKLPDQIINKPKLGFNPPMGQWLKTDLKNLINEYLSQETVQRRGLFNYKFIEDILKENFKGRRDRSLHIWSLIVLEEWFRQYYD